MLLQPDCNMQALMYNPMIMQASCTMYSLVAFCKGENESDLQPVIFPFSAPLVSEDSDADVLMAINHSGKPASLIGMMGSLPGGIATLVDVTQLLATMQKAFNSQAAVSDVKCEATDADADDSSSSDQSSILGPPPLMSCKPSTQALNRLSQFAFNHVLASHIQAQLLQRVTMPACDEPVPLEARIPESSLGGVVSLFDLPLVRPLVAKSTQKSATELSTDSSKSATKQVSTSSAPVVATRAAPVVATGAPAPTAGDSILGRPPVPRFQGPQKNSVVPAAPGGSSVRTGLLQGPAFRPLPGRNFAGAGNWPRPRGESRSVMTSQGGERKQWTGGWKDGNNKPESGWQWNSETASDVSERQHWNSGPEAVQPDWTSYGGQPGMKAEPPGRNVAKGPHKPSVSQSAFPSLRGKPPPVWQCLYIVEGFL